MNCGALVFEVDIRRGEFVGDHEGGEVEGGEDVIVPAVKELHLDCFSSVCGGAVVFGSEAEEGGGDGGRCEDVIELGEVEVMVCQLCND